MFCSAFAGSSGLYRMSHCRPPICGRDSRDTARSQESSLSWWNERVRRHIWKCLQERDDRIGRRGAIKSQSHKETVVREALAKINEGVEGIFCMMTPAQRAMIDDHSDKVFGGIKMIEGALL